MQKMKKRSSTTLHQSRKPGLKAQRQTTPNYEVSHKPTSSLLKNRSHSSFKITISRNLNANQNQGSNRQHKSVNKKKNQVEINIKLKKQSEQRNSAHKEKTSSISKPQSPLKHRGGAYTGSRKTPASILTNRSNKPIPEQIMEYVKKRDDVEIVEFFQEYKKQFYTKSKVLQTFIYESDEPQKIKNTYLNQIDTHFRNGLQAVMLKLFRSGVIVPQSYTNLRAEAVEEIQKWVIGWIHRKISYGKFVEEEQAQIQVTQDTIKQIQDYKRMIDNEDTSF